MKGNRYLFKFFYIGENYYGSQRQSNHITIEDCILNALWKKKYINNVDNAGFEAASRTDRHVSARGSAFTFITSKKPILMEINSVLPEDIGLWAYVKVPLDYLSRFNAEWRHYKYLYFINNKDPLLNLKGMQKACKELKGRHDFINFIKKDKEEVLTVRDLISAKFEKHANLIIFDFKSRAFLRQQIRRMITKIIEVGKKEITLDEFIELFDSSKNFSYQPAQAKGLILWDINFGVKIKFEIDLKSLERMKMFLFNQYRDYQLKSELFRIMEHDDFSY
jgi:tRNA pseudouridine38-40 synthase